MRAFPLIGAVLLTACQTYDVSTDFDPAAGFATYRTYSWLPSEAPRGMNPLMFKRVKDSIDRSLAARGYTQADPGDFAITFTVGERDSVQTSGWPYGWGAGWGRGWGYGPGWGYGWGGPYGWRPYYPPVDVYTVTERSIIIDIFDARTKAPAWHGVVSRDTYSDRVDYTKLDQAVGTLLAQFPPQPKAQAQ